MTEPNKRPLRTVPIAELCIGDTILSSTEQNIGVIAAIINTGRAYPICKISWSGKLDETRPEDITLLPLRPVSDEHPLPIRPIYYLGRK